MNDHVRRVLASDVERTRRTVRCLEDEHTRAVLDLERIEADLEANKEVLAALEEHLNGESATPSDDSA